MVRFGVEPSRYSGFPAACEPDLLWTPRPQTSICQWGQRWSHLSFPMIGHYVNSGPHARVNLSRRATHARPLSFPSGHAFSARLCQPAVRIGTITPLKTRLAGWFPPSSRAIVTRSVYSNMEQEPQKKALADAAVPKPPAKPDVPGDDPAAASEPEQVVRPEDEALVVERLRELGYIE